MDDTAPGDFHAPGPAAGASPPPRIDPLQAAAHECTHEEPDSHGIATLYGLLAARAS